MNDREQRPTTTLNSHAQQPIPFHPPLGAEAGPTAGLTGLLEELTLPHFLLDTAALHEFAKPADSLLDAFTLTNRQLDHAV
jgi:hypothetical protein